MWVDPQTLNGDDDTVYHLIRFSKIFQAINCLICCLCLLCSDLQLMSSFFNVDILMCVFPQKNAASQHPVVHGLSLQAPPGYSHSVVWRAQPVQAPACSGDQVSHGSADYDCQANSPRNGVSTVCVLLSTYAVPVVFCLSNLSAYAVPVVFCLCNLSTCAVPVIFCLSNLSTCAVPVFFCLCNLSTCAVLVFFCLCNLAHLGDGENLIANPCCYRGHTMEELKV